jgi:soluble lytic murein transglycosylase-like protein
MRRVLVLVAAACLASAAVLALGSARAETTSAATARPHVPARAAPAAQSCALPDAYRRAFERAARVTQLPLPMLIAVGEVESHLTQEARSQAGAQGVLQVLPSTASSLGLDPSRAAENVLAGAVYLRRLLDRFGSVDTALAAYNAGPSAVERAGGAPSGETLTYVANVTARWRALLRCR